MNNWIRIEEQLPPEGRLVKLLCNYMMFDYEVIGSIINGCRGKCLEDDNITDMFYRSAILAWKPLEV